MRSVSLSVFFLLSAFISFSWPDFVQAQKNPNVAGTDPLHPREQLTKFHLPPGFEIQLVAAEPDINKPINIAFDVQGRLWVTGSVEYPFAAKDGASARDKVWILEDFAPDGKAKKISVYAENLNIPIGVLPTTKGAIVYSIPNIWSFEGTEKGTNKKLLYGSFGFNDTHGMTGEFTWGLDGWIYCCHGFANTSKVKSQGDTAISMQSGNTYRIKPDGSRIEQFTWGQVNPFGLTFDTLGNLYSTDCHSRPLYQLLKGAYYPSFGKPHDGLGFAPDMVTHDHGSTALCGITFYDAHHFPVEFRDNIFIGNVVTNRINRDRIQWNGTSPKGIEMPDLVKCGDPWFRPVDIKLGPDGCLYVADFYNRIIGHYEVPLNHPGRDREKGRIWRIVYRGKDGKIAPPPMPNLLKASIAELTQALGSSNLTVRNIATRLLSERGEESVGLTKEAFENGTPLQQGHALWVLERLGKLDEKALASVTTHPEPLVRNFAFKIIAERKVWTSNDTLTKAISINDDRFVMRAAVEAMRAHPSLENVKALVQFRAKVDSQDTHLIHVVRMALRDQMRSPELAKAIANTEWTEVVSRAIADVGPGVRNSELAALLGSHLEKYSEPVEKLINIAHTIVRFGGPEMRMRVLKMVQKKHPQDLFIQGLVLKAIHQATQERGDALGKGERFIAEEITNKLLASEPAHVEAGVDLANQFKFASAQEDLKKALDNPKINEKTQRNALTALANIDLRKNSAYLAEILIRESAPIGIREQAAQSLAQTPLPETQSALVKAFEKSPARLQTAIAAALASSKPGAELLLVAVGQGKASPRLLQDKGIETKILQAKIPQATEKIAKLTKGLPGGDQRLLEMITKRREAFANFKSDANLGKMVFLKHCAVCHQIGNQGAKIGPQLDGIGIRGLERILEDVLDPNRNVDQAFRSTSLVLENGTLVSGLLLREEGKVLIMADKEGKEVRIPGANVLERSVSQLSPMPANVIEQIPENDFYHLLTYLLEQKVK